VAGLPKLEMKRSTPNRGLNRTQKLSSYLHSIFSLKPNNAKDIESIVKVIAKVDYRDSLEILDLELKTLDNSTSKI
jgi:hypothetical protein